MTEQDLVVSSGDISLAGTLTWPDGSAHVPLVLMIHGSGPLDRDENIPIQKLNIFNALAKTFVENGIASFRYDKRGCGKSLGKFIEAGYLDLVADAEACLAHLRENFADRANGIYLLGHSEGTLIAAEIALRQPVDGLVQLAPFVEDMEKILRDQARKGDEMIDRMSGFQGKLVRFITRLTGRPSQQQDRIIDKVKSTNDPTIRVGLQKLGARWLRELFAANPPEIYSSVNAPTLLIGGGKDLQCNPADSARIAEILGDRATVHMVDDLTHILRRDPDHHTFESYKKLLKQPMDEGIQQVAAAWILKQAATRSAVA